MLTTTPIALNPTDIASPQYVTLVQQYRHFAKESAENIVKLAETLVIARQNLAPVHFDAFCKEVGLDKEGSTYRKLIKIGEEASRFEPFYDHLPSAWTTVYKLATIEKIEFDRVTKSKQFSPFMTAKDITEVLGKNAPKKNTAGGAMIMIDLRKLGESDRSAVYQEIAGLRERFKIGVKLPDALKMIAHLGDQTASTEHLFQVEQAA